MGKGYLLERRPHLLELCRGRPDQRFHVLLHPLHEILPGDPYLKAPHVRNQAVGVVGHGEVGRGGIPGVVAGDDIQKQSAVGHVLGHRPYLVERRGEGHEAEAGDPPVGGLQPHDPAAGGRLPDGAPGVRAQRARALIGGHGGRRATAAAAGYGAEVPGIAGYAEPAGFRG